MFLLGNWVSFTSSTHTSSGLSNGKESKTMVGDEAGEGEIPTNRSCLTAVVSVETESGAAASGFVLGGEDDGVVCRELLAENPSFVECDPEDLLDLSVDKVSNQIFRLCFFFRMSSAD